MTDTPSQTHAEFIALLSTQTVAALKAAQGNSLALEEATQQFLSKATKANLRHEEIENILGVNEPSIMDLAGLSGDDEEIIIDVFEQFIEK